VEALSGRLGEKSFWGYLAVGLLSLAGGICVFIFLVVPDRQPESGVPRDVQVFFTNVYMNQTLAKNETGRFTPALNQLEVEQDVCMRYQCLLTLSPDGQDYTFKLSKGGHTWSIHSRSPVPKEQGEAQTSH
jgi:hypothetical protein